MSAHAILLIRKYAGKQLKHQAPLPKQARLSKTTNERSCLAQGDTFIALAHEDGGRMGVPALGLINYLAHRFGSTKTERAIVTNYALQRLHTTSQRGVAASCRKLQPLPLGPALLSPGVTVHMLGVPPRRPTGLPVLRPISAVPLLPWQLAAAIPTLELQSKARLLWPLRFRN